MIQQIEQSGIIHIFKGKQNIPVKLVIGEILTAEIIEIFPTGNIQIKINNRVLNAQPQREPPLNKGDTVYVKVEKPLRDGTIPLRVLSHLESQVSKQSILELQKLIEVFSKRSSVTQSIRELINLLQNKDSLRQYSTLFKSILLTDIESGEKLKKAVLNSGVLFEAKLRQALSNPSKLENIQEDLKILLNYLIEESKAQGIEEVADKAQKIFRQIESYQLLSRTYQSFFTFLPILWKEIEGGSIAFKSFKKQEEDCHTVFVTLKMKEEVLSFVVTMINKSFFISFSGQPETLQTIKNYENELKNRFHQKGMFLSGINYVTKIEEILKQWDIKEGLINIRV